MFYRNFPLDLATGTLSSHARGLKLSAALGAALLMAAAPVSAYAAEGGFSVYGLGGAGFNAGITPPAGTYVTPLAGLYTGVIDVGSTVGGVPVSAGARVGFFQSGVNLLYVPEVKALDGQVGFSVTVPVGYIALAADVSVGNASISREVEGPGLGDIIPKVQIGWSSGTFFNTVYASAVLPTGKYNPGFSASTGLHRPAIDMGWAFTYIEPQTKIQFNAQAGVTFNFINTETDYQSGTEFHLDWAVGKDFGNGITAGVVGYNYRQLTDDSGSGARLGGYKGSVDAIGLGLNYSTEFGTQPVSLSFRHYREFNAVNRFEGSTTLATATFAF